MTALLPTPISTMPLMERVAIVMPSSVDIAGSLSGKAALITYCKTANLELTAMFEASKDQRKFLLAAARNEFDVLLVTSVSVLGFDLAGRVKAVLELSSAGAELRSLAEPFFDFSTATTGNALTSVMVWISKELQAQAATKIRKGQDRARTQNRKIGRPRKAVNVGRALMLLADGLPLSKAAQAVGCSRSHLRRALDEHQQAHAPRPVFPEGNEGSPMTQILRAITHAELKESK